MLGRLLRHILHRVAARPDSAEALHQLAQAALRQDRAEAAVTLAARAVAAAPDEPEMLLTHGIALGAARRPQEAVDSLQRAVQIRPEAGAAHFALATSWQALGKHELALQAYRRAVECGIDTPETHVRMGALCYEMGRLHEALPCLERALAARPDFPEAHNGMGIVLLEQRDTSGALREFERATELNPDYAEAWSNRGDALMLLERPDEALASFARALALKPGLAGAWSNRGNALLQLERVDEALADYEHAIALRPDDAAAWSNRGVALVKLKRLDEALSSYGKALAVEPDYARARFNESVCRLLTGDFERGWRDYEWRWRDGQLKQSKRDFTQPLWLGKESIAGKTILLHAEAGLGDTIQFCRYARRVAAQGATVLLEVQPPLKSLMAGLQGVSRVFTRGEPLPAFDCHSPLLSLPLACNTTLATIPAEVPYLASDPRRVHEWQARLGERTLPRVGLAWSGRTEQRSLPLAVLAGLLSAKAQFVSLQKEVRAADRALLDARKDIVHFGGELKDFADTAALVELMDVVITVDTAVAHLAGAMGRKTWVLLQFVPEWRWLLERADSPWYPTARLFRQPAIGDWAGVMQRVNEEMREELRPEMDDGLRNSGRGVAAPAGGVVASPR